MAHTYRTTVLATYIKNLINTNKASLGVDTVLYGMHENVPPGRTVTVTAGTKSRSLARVASPGAGTMNDMIVMINVYLNEMLSEEVGRLAVDTLAEDVEYLLHQNTTMGGNIFHGFVTTWDPGFKFKTNSMFRVVQMIYVGRSKTNLTVIP